MSIPRETVLLKPDSRKVLIAMANAEMEPTLDNKKNAIYYQALPTA